MGTKYFSIDLLLQSSANELWPLVSDTDTFNRDAGLPQVTLLEKRKDGQRVRQTLLAGLVTMEWIERPFEWEANKYFIIQRDFILGLISQIRVRCELLPRDGGGTRLRYDLWIEPRYPVLSFLIGLIGRKQMATFKNVFQLYDEKAQRRRPGKPQITLGSTVHGETARIEKLYEKLLSQGASKALLEQLVAVIRYADDVTVNRLQPYTLADAWGEDRQAVLELFLLATKEGLLDFRWDSICPHCRGAKKTSAHLETMNRSAFCESCDIDFDVDFEQLVELTFQTNPSIRRISNIREYCVGSPQRTPFVMIKKMIPAQSNVILSLHLEPGDYRIRTPGVKKSAAVSVERDGGKPRATISFDHDVPFVSDDQLAPDVEMRVENPTASAQMLIIERASWADDAVTGAHAILKKRFRDLFPHEVLRSGTTFTLGSKAIVFTDLKGSTTYYQAVGDAQAIVDVTKHFALLEECITSHGGEILKSIGDAVMAVFQSRVSAIQALLEAQRLLHAEWRTKPLRFRAGILYGPCYTLEIYGRQDILGGCVNQAARLEGQSDDSVVISQEVYDDPEVKALFGPDGDLIAESFQAKLKGFEKPVPLWHVRQRK